MSAEPTWLPLFTARSALFCTNITTLKYFCAEAVRQDLRLASEQKVIYRCAAGPVTSQKPGAQPSGVSVPPYHKNENHAKHELGSCAAFLLSRL